MERYCYDDLGYLLTKTQGINLDTTYVRDYLGRILEEKKDTFLNEFLLSGLYENLNLTENALYKIRYEYDEAGNKT